jgi:hypothetical protein
MAADTPRQFRRRIVALAAPNRVQGALEDDFHRFEVELEHDGSVVTAIRSRTPRAPRSNCPEAEQPLQGFVGRRLEAEHVPLDPRLQCTHLFDLTRFLMARAAAGSSREYEISVSYPENGRMRAEIHRDGRLALAWVLVERRIETAGPFAGIDLAGKARWPAGLDKDTLEAAKLLRRGVWLGADRSKIAIHIVDGKLEPRIEQRALEKLRGACFAHQPGRQELGGSARGMNIRDFSDHPEQMLPELPKPGTDHGFR